MIVKQFYKSMNIPQSDLSYIQTNHNCQNSSSSKQIYSFPKQPRFPVQKQPLTARTQYINESIFDKEERAQSFTKQKRQLVFQNEEEFANHPPPNIYDVSKNQQSSGFGITIAEKAKVPSVKKSPGPGWYKSQSFDRLNKTITFPKQKKQFKFPIKDTKGADTPGPYLIQTSKLKQILSNYKNIKQTKISKITSHLNFAQLKSSYLDLKSKQNPLIPKDESFIRKSDIKSTFNNTIMFKKEKTAVFGKAARTTFLDIKKSKSPSPNNYSLFSEFARRNKPDTLNRKHQSLRNFRIRPEVKQKLKTLPVDQSLLEKSNRKILQ